MNHAEVERLQAVVGENLHRQNKHLYAVTCSRRLRDWFRKRYWVRCWECELLVGPFLSKDEACKEVRGE